MSWGGLAGGLWLHRGHYSGVPAGPSKLVTQLTPWHSSQVFEGKLVSQLWGIKLFGPDSEITIWKSSLSLSVTPQFLITWERCWPFLLASIKPVLGRSLAGGPGTAQGAEQSNTSLSVGQHTKKPIGSLQISVCAAAGAAQDGHARPWGTAAGFAVGEKPRVAQAGRAGGNRICSSPTAAFSPLGCSPAIGSAVE